MTAGNGLNLILVTYKVQDTGPPEPSSRNYKAQSPTKKIMKKDTRKVYCISLESGSFTVSVLMLYA